LRTAAAALLALTLLSCTMSSKPVASAPRLQSPSPTIANPADTKAADFRTRLNLLLGEHVFAIAKESSAAGRGDEYTGYLRLLTANGADLTELMRSALGDTAAARFDQIWRAQNDEFVNYTIGLVTHNKSMSDRAVSGLITVFVPQFSQFLATATQVPLDPITQLATQRVLETKAMIDDQAAQSYRRQFADLQVVYAQASRIGDALAARITQKFPDKFPGNASSLAADLRVSMNTRMQEDLYLATMTADAAIGGRSAEEAAAANALASTAGALGALLSGLFGASAATRFGRIWAARNMALIGYASASSGAARQSALSALKDSFTQQFPALVQDLTGVASGSLRPATTAAIGATVIVIDDLRSRSQADVGGADRAAAAAMAVVADLVTAAAVSKLHARFGA
jgi:hypothetical protein